MDAKGTQNQKNRDSGTRTLLNCARSCPSARFQRGARYLRCRHCLPRRTSRLRIAMPMRPTWPQFNHKFFFPSFVASRRPPTIGFRSRYWPTHSPKHCALPPALLSVRLKVLSTIPSFTNSRRTRTKQIRRTRPPIEHQQTLPRTRTTNCASLPRSSVEVGGELPLEIKQIITEKSNPANVF